jgi:hypothetical protein
MATQMINPTVRIPGFSRSSSKLRERLGLGLMTLPVLFLLFDGTIKILMIAPVVETAPRLGYAPDTMFGLGILTLICLALYVIPRTSVLGAILLTGYLGGAVSTHVRIDDPLFSHVLFPVYLGLMLWGGLYLQNSSVRRLFPLAKKR